MRHLLFLITLDKRQEVETIFHSLWVIHFCTVQDFGGVPALGGRKYEKFRGTYMGLAPHQHDQKNPIPFPIDQDAVKNPHFFYVQYLDGGPKMSKLLADIREGIEKRDWPVVNVRYMLEPEEFLSNGSECN